MLNWMLISGFVVVVIKNIPTHITQKEVHSFLGHAGYYRRFIKKISKLASPFFSLLMKDVQFIWNVACQTTFLKLKEKLSIALILRGPNWALPFHISSDSSDPRGYWWPPTYSTWTPTIISFSFLVSLIVAQFTIFGSCRVLNFWSHFEALNDVFSASNGSTNMSLFRTWYFLFLDVVLE